MTSQNKSLQNIDYKINILLRFFGLANICMNIASELTLISLQTCRSTHKITESIISQSIS